MDVLFRACFVFVCVVIVWVVCFVCVCNMIVLVVCFVCVCSMIIWVVCFVCVYKCTMEWMVSKGCFLYLSVLVCM